MKKHPPGPDRSQRVADLPLTLADLGIEKMQSSRWQKIAAIPQAELSRYIADKEATGQEMTTAGLLIRTDVRALRSSASFERYTPARYVEAEEDPAVPRATESVVFAVEIERCLNGLVGTGAVGGIEVNGAEDASRTKPFVDRLQAEWECGNVSEAILLVTDATPSQWFQPLW